MRSEQSPTSGTGLLFASPKAAFLQGAKTISPMIAGAGPFGMILGVVTADMGLSATEGIGMSILMFAGTAQLVALQLYAAGAALWVIVLSATIINLRHVIYSASISKHFRPVSIWWKVIISYALVDQTYAFAIAQFEKHPDSSYKEWFFLGMALFIFTIWHLAMVIGYYAGALIPESWSLGFVVPLIFVALLALAVEGWPFIGAALVAATVSIAGLGLPHNLGLIIAILSGIAFGTIAEGRKG